MTQKSSTRKTRCRARACLSTIQHYGQVIGNVSQTCHFFGISRGQVYGSLRGYREEGLAVNGARGGEEDPPHPRRAHCFQDPECSQRVLLKILPWVFQPEPDVCVRREVEDDVVTAHGLRQSVFVEDVPLNELKSVITSGTDKKLRNPGGQHCRSR